MASSSFSVALRMRTYTCDVLKSKYGSRNRAERFERESDCESENERGGGGGERETVSKPRRQRGGGDRESAREKEQQ